MLGSVYEIRQWARASGVMSSKALSCFNEVITPP